MGADVDVQDLADRLNDARTSRTAIPQLSDDVPGLDLATGYQVQRLLREGRGEVVGWKLGVTSRAKQVQVGVDSPIRGFLATDHVLDHGEPLVCAEHVNPRCEPEIAFVMGEDLAGAHATTTEVLAATAYVAAAIEVIDSRYADYRFTMPDVVADNSSAGRYVLGSPVPAAGIDLRLVGVVMEQNGDVVATASGAASLGHPAAAVAWLVRSLAADGEGLRKGDVILSGGLTAATPVSPGDVVVVSVDRLGSVEPGVPLVALGAGEGRWLIAHEGRSYLVLEHEGGHVVTDALCPHKQLPLAEGLVRDGALVCPGHWYAFDLATGACRTTGDVTLPTYPVVEHDGALYAEVPEPVAPLSWSERLAAHARSGR